MHSSFQTYIVCIQCISDYKVGVKPIGRRNSDKNFREVCIKLLPVFHECFYCIHQQLR